MKPSSLDTTMKQGDALSTPFGPGKVVFYRATDAIYVVQLPFGTLYANTASITESCSSSKSRAQAMELNVAYEALDAMRKLNLEVECQQRGIPHSDAQYRCTTCLLSSSPPPLSTTAETARNRRFPRIQNLVHQQIKPRLGGIQHSISTKPCLSCGSPVCSTHASTQFKQQGISVCVACHQLFTLDFVVECMTAPTDDLRKQRMDHMVDVYDRILLLLRYSSQFIPQVSASLKESTARQNKVGIGSSSAGIVSGVLGVAAAATILTPAGPPLLIASLLFGGSATAVQTGTDVKNYYSETNRLADRVLALHGMLKSILKVTSTLRDALLLNNLRTDGFNDDDENSQMHLLGDAMYEKHKGTLLAGLTVGRAGAAGMELGALATAAEVSAGRFISRGTTGILRTARFARIAGGALSAATLVFETKCMTDTIQSIRAGNPCEKAALLEAMQKELPDFVPTSSLDRELQHYLEGIALRKRRMTEEECVRLILDASQLQDYNQEEDTIGFCRSGDTVTSSSTAHSGGEQEELRMEDSPSVVVSSSASTTTSSSSSTCISTTSSLLERIERFKRKESDTSSNNNAPLIERISMYKTKRDSSLDGDMATANDKNVPVATLG